MTKVVIYISKFLLEVVFLKMNFNIFFLFFSALL